eukprot:6486954-Amphidinium_carterae.1
MVCAGLSYVAFPDEPAENWQELQQIQADEVAVTCIIRPQTCIEADSFVARCQRCKPHCKAEPVSAFLLNPCF